MGDINYHHLRYFWAVAHDGNLTRTAQRLNLSQSALSVQIRKLEERLGQSLFERANRQLRLTEAGRIALDHADAIFSAGDELLDTLRRTGRARRVLRVGALSTLSRNFQMAFLKPVLALEDVDIVLRSVSAGELHGALESLALDVVLTNQPPAADAASPFLIHRVDEQTVSLVGTRARAEHTSLAQLLATQPVILPSAGSSIRSAFDALADRLGVRPQIAAEVDDMAMMRLMAREDIGVAVLPPIVVRDELASGLLVEIDSLSGLVETFFAVTIARRFPNPLLSLLIKG